MTCYRQVLEIAVDGPFMINFNRLQPLLKRRAMASANGRNIQRHPAFQSRSNVVDEVRSRLPIALLCALLFA